WPAPNPAWVGTRATSAATQAARVATDGAPPAPRGRRRDHGSRVDRRHPRPAAHRRGDGGGLPRARSHPVDRPRLQPQPRLPALPRPQGDDARPLEGDVDVATEPGGSFAADAPVRLLPPGPGAWRGGRPL